MPTAAGNSTRHARVAAIGAAGAVWRVEAEVEVCVAVGADLARHAAHLQAAGAGVAVGGLAVITWLLHTQEPSTPVEQDHPHLSTVIKKGLSIRMLFKNPLHVVFYITIISVLSVRRLISGRF